jgi:hypothetical protein
VGNQPCQGTLSQKRGYLLNTLPLSKFCENYAVRILDDVILERRKKERLATRRWGKYSTPAKEGVQRAARNFRRTMILVVTDEPQTDSES